MALDYSTVHFCSALLSVSYGTMFLVLWAKRREKPLLLWSLSLFLAAGAGYGFTLQGGAWATALLYGLIAGNVTLIWAGGRAFDGRAPFEWRMAALPVLIAAIHYGVTLSGEPHLATALATLLLGLNVFAVGRYFFTEGAAVPRFGRKIVAGSLFAYIPIYLVSAALSLLEMENRISAIIILVGDLVLNNVFVVGLFSVIEDRTRHALRVMAETDEMTSALNRSGFLKQGARRVTGEQKAAMLLADLDHFKQINDTFGHAAGDAVLKGFVERVRAVLGENHLVGRMGGEEFAILLPGRDTGHAAGQAEAMRVAMAAGPILWGDIAIMATVSIGVAAHQCGEPLEISLRRADEALYRAKRTDRNRIAA